MKWQPTIANHILDKNLITKIYEELTRLNSKEIKIKNNSIRKWAKELNGHVFQRKYTSDQQVHKVLLNHQRNVNQNHNEISPHICQNGYCQKDKN